MLEPPLCHGHSIHVIVEDSPSLSFASFNPIALRRAKIVCNFGPSECNRVDFQWLKTVLIYCWVDREIFSVMHSVSGPLGFDSGSATTGIRLVDLNISSPAILSVVPEHLHGKAYHHFNG